MKPQTSGAPESISLPGDMLRHAREARDWTLADVANQLNLTRQRLEQLEAGEFEKLPGHTFARGYLRAYAKLLGLDPQEIVAAFDRQIGTEEVASEVKSIGRINEPMRVPQTALRVLSLLVLLVLGAVGFFWWQERSVQMAAVEVAAPEHIEVESADGTTLLHTLTELEDEAVAESQVAEVPASASEPAESTVQSPSTTATDEAVPLNASETASETTSVAPVEPVAEESAPTAETQADTNESTPAPVLAEGEGLVEIVFNDTCWVQIKDANKRILHSSIKRAGEELRVSGPIPIEVHLGVAKAAAITFNGNQLDMSPYSSGETARIKLGQ